MKNRILTLCFTGLSLLSLGAQDLDLSSYLELVEKNSKDLYSADIDQKIATAQEKLARSQTRPMISASAGYTRNFLDITMPAAAYVTPNTGTPGMYDINYVDVPANRNNDFEYSVGAQQLLFDMKIFRALEASARYKDLTGTIYEANRQGILTAAKRVYYQTILLKEVYQVKKETEQNAYDTYLDIQKKYDNELASELDVLQAEVNWQINIPETTTAARNRDLALNNLKHLAGIDLDNKVSLTGSLTFIPVSPEDEELGTIMSARPDYQAIQGQIALQEINVSATRAEFYPTLSASFGYGWKTSSDDFELKDGTDGMTAGLTLTIPIFYGGSRFAKMDDARLDLEKSRVSLLKKQDDIRTEIINLQLLLDEASSRIVSAETTLKTAKKAYSIMEVSSRNGMATQLDMKDARLNLSSALLNFYAASYDYLDAYFQWQQATGEGDKLPF
ncbi:MAG: hypothetical protein B6241_09580 [Spirochaetaceae bacterium 4572_59]|nr:MAG: hypothetical protein B6241_09580 [Spirochaetaceae bacterium 4572_59]